MTHQIRSHYLLTILKITADVCTVQLFHLCVSTKQLLAIPLLSKTCNFKTECRHNRRSWQVNILQFTLCRHIYVCRSGGSKIYSMYGSGMKYSEREWLTLLWYCLSFRTSGACGWSDNIIHSQGHSPWVCIQSALLHSLWEL